MPWVSQEVYHEGQDIRVEVTLTTNHGGHMELYVCNLGDASTQEEIFEQTCLPLVYSVLNGYNATYFVYG